MKYLIIVTLLMVNLNAWFRVDANVQVNSSQIEASVYNQWHKPIICKGYATGLNNFNFWAKSWMNNVIIYPGQYAYVYVNTNPGQYFVNGYADIRCRW